MKKLMYHAGLMIAVILLLPLLIVRGCGPKPAQKPPDIITEEPLVKIRVYYHTKGTTETMDLEEYLKGVVAAEMPADFDMEALKAQAVAARTFAYGRLTGEYRSKEGVHDGVHICTNSAHCQAWISREAALKKWNVLFAARNWGKISKAVNDTKGMIVTYKGKIANTLFHASSGGRTENAEDVWKGVSVPYLKSVESGGEEGSRGYVTTVMMDKSEMVEKILNNYPEADLESLSDDDIKILNYTEGGRVKTIKVGNIIMRGADFRILFGLRSASFSVIPAGEDRIRITTTGYGHGVGMSQWGADSLAKKGGTYREILQHYYTGVDIISIPEFERRFAQN